MRKCVKKYEVNLLFSSRSLKHVYFTEMTMISLGTASHKFSASEEAEATLEFPLLRPVDVSDTMKRRTVTQSSRFPIIKRRKTVLDEACCRSEEEDI